MAGAPLVDMDVQGDTRKKMRKSKGKRWSRCSIVVAVGKRMYCKVFMVSIPGCITIF